MTNKNRTPIEATISTGRDSLSESKRRVVTLLQRAGQLTKRQLSAEGHMGWATAVKVINQLEDEKIVHTCGFSEKSAGRKGKHALLYSLTDDCPLAIGVDIELRTTRIVLTNLKGDILADESYRTPQPMDMSGSVQFLEESIKDFIKKKNIDIIKIDGIGIGKPGISYPSLGFDEFSVAHTISEQLNHIFNIRVRLETNTSAYAVFEKWANSQFSSKDFIFVSIRTGVGTGIIIDGHLFRGVHGLSGEIGHLKVIPNGPPCRCGAAGCMETVVNQYYLFERYRTSVLKDSSWAAGNNADRLFSGLADLFTRAKQGEDDALAVVRTAMGYLGYGISNAITVLDVSKVIISGHFGPDGDVIVPLLEEEIRANVLPKKDLKVDYLEYDPDGWVKGAALLILKDYLVDVPGKIRNS